MFKYDKIIKNNNNNVEIFSSRSNFTYLVKILDCCYNFRVRVIALTADFQSMKLSEWPEILLRKCRSEIE